MVQNSRPLIRIRKKTMPGEVPEKAQPLSSPEDRYRVHVHDVILDQVTSSLQTRYSSNGALCDDFACLDPKNFKAIVEAGGPSSESFRELSKCLLRFDDRATPARLKSELCSLATQWQRLKLPHVDSSYTVRSGTADEMEVEDESDIELTNKSCKSCKDCAICVYHVLSKYNLMTASYHVIGLAYKFLLTLSFSQVSCERTFSTLKFVKNRLRTKLTQDHLEAFMLMCTEKDILMKLENDVVIDKVAVSSDVLRRLLVL